MLFLEAIALFLAALYLVYRMLRHPNAKKFVADLALISVASWLAEESSIRLYGFYSYSPGWHLFVAQVPLLVITVWPMIIHSAWDMASQLSQSRRRLVPFIAGAIVGTDALFIEPVAGNSGLWSWIVPGIFNAPPIVIIGWAYFAFMCILLLEKENQRSRSKVWILAFPLLATLGTHLLLIGTWWGLFRWISVPADQVFTVGVAWCLSLILVYFILRHPAGKRIKRETLLIRLPGALVAFTLLVFNPLDSSLLVAYGFAFVPPYLTLLVRPLMK